MRCDSRLNNAKIQIQGAAGHHLCSASKMFEKLILKRINKIQDENLFDLTGANQHGFKCNKSTSTLLAELQSII
jgi:hypothetical protein